MKKLSPLFLSFLLVACGGGAASEEGPSGVDAQLGSANVRLRGGITGDGRSLNGSGSSVWRRPLQGSGEAVSYELEFTLANQGHLALVSHADDNLNRGFQVQFSRSGSGPNSLIVTLTGPEGVRYGNDSSGRNLFAEVDASRPMRFQVDVHNGEAGRAHVLIWSPTLNGDNFSERAALLNTEDDFRGGSPGKGSGTRWGLELERATVTRALVSPPKFHD